MSPLDRNERELVFDYWFGRTSAEEAAKTEAWIARSASAAAFHARIRAALAPLESLPAEPCPEELAERTIRLLCATARDVQEAVRTRTARLRWHHPREDFWLCLSSNILMKSSS